MRILFFSPYFYPYISGLTIYPLRILKHLSKKNKITVLAFTKAAPRQNQPLKVITLPYFFRLSKGFISPQSFYYFLKEVKKNDLVILNLPSFEGLGLAILAKIFGKKIISIYHCQVNLGQDIFSRIVVGCLNFATYIQSLLSDTIVGHIDYIEKTSIGKVFKKKALTTLPPVDDLPISSQYFDKLKKLKKEYWIGFVGRISKEKGIEYLIQSIKGLKDVKLAFAGPSDVVGEKKYREKINNLLEVNKINYVFLGQLTPQELGAFYKTIDVLALPSINETEAFGMSQAEAMILGTPAIATNIPGVRLPVKLTKMGVLVRPENSKELADAIKKILKNKNQYANDVLQNQAKNLFDINRVYHFYEKIINEKN